MPDLPSILHGALVRVLVHSGLSVAHIGCSLDNRKTTKTLSGLDSKGAT